MTLKEKVFEHIKKHGPQTNADLVAKFKVMKASMRRTCGELVKEGKIAPLPSKEKRLWGIASDAREPVAVKPKAPSMPAPSLPKSEPPVDPDDWRRYSF